MGNSKKIRPIDANLLERRIRQHSLWNREGVIEMIRLMPTLDESPQEDCSKSKMV